METVKLIKRRSLKGEIYFQMYSREVDEFIPVYYGRNIINEEIEVLGVEKKTDVNNNEYSIMIVPEENLEIMLAYDTGLPYKAYIKK